MFNSHWDEEIKTRPKRPYTGVELFAGAEGLAPGLEGDVLPGCAALVRRFTLGYLLCRPSGAF